MYHVSSYTCNAVTIFPPWFCFSQFHTLDALWFIFLPAASGRRVFSLRQYRDLFGSLKQNRIHILIVH